MLEWSPSNWGRTFTGTGNWRLALDGDTLEFRIGTRQFKAEIKGNSPVIVHEGIFWTDLTLKVREQDSIQVDGIPNVHGRAIRQAIESVIEKQRIVTARRHRDALLKSHRERFAAAIEPILQWHHDTMTDIRLHQEERRWLTAETLRHYTASKPPTTITASGLTKLLEEPEIQSYLSTGLDNVFNAVKLWDTALSSFVDKCNEAFVRSELTSCKPFFDCVERTPLTEEQARAVICFDNRVQVVAAAGSGKTSTMIAKAAYAVERGIVAPNNICMLAFNDSAAKELDDRIKAALKRIGRQNVQIAAMTFHKFGLEIIGKATGRKPSIATWIEQERDAQKLDELIDELRRHNLPFRAKWDLFRIVFSRDIPRFGVLTDHDDYDRNSKKTGIRTLKGDLVKSEEERTLADWLFYNGVVYEYERPYEFPTATDRYTQYHPDFYYPDMGLYHEHQALNHEGEPPENFRDYMKKVEWVRQQHAKSKTDYIETTSAQMWEGTAFDYLEREFKKRGVTLAPNPDRSIPGREPLKHNDLVRLLRSFITHTKSNCLSIEDLGSRLNDEAPDAFKFRHWLFLSLFEPLRRAWDEALKSTNAIDFEDMLNLASEHLEAGNWKSPFELVMVDEFQDASWARARLSQALVRQPGRFLFVVGDDWQSINRFAGADISVMTGFKDWCRDARVLRLERTFRCPQSLCNASSAFVMRNDRQIPKTVWSETPEVAPTLQVFQVSDAALIQDAIHLHLKSIYEHLRLGTHPLGLNERATVYLLGRYRNDEHYVRHSWQRDFGDKMTVEFRTIHKSKGSEADYIILPHLVKHGFPTQKEDDPVLRLAMPIEDPYPKAEERRLFYVALTRARRSVAMFTVKGKESPFLIELLKDGWVQTLDASGLPSNAIICPTCVKGIMIERTGKNGPFLSCTNYPSCKYSMNPPQYPDAPRH